MKVEFKKPVTFSTVHRAFTGEGIPPIPEDAAAEARLTVAQQPAEQHPDDAAVDRFAAAMKAKLKKKRQEGRSGWQFMASEQLSALLHEHVRKGDPVDVASIAMMLHQNGQVIEPPAAVVTRERVNMEHLLAENARLRTQPHPAIIHCDNCGCDWLDNGLNPVGCPYCELRRETEHEECACEYREIDLIETLRDCANALDELLPRDHAYRKIVDQANRLIEGVTITDDEY